MKVFKQLLWFIIPSVLIWAFWFVYDAIPSEEVSAPIYNSPRFGSTSYYYELFTKDPVYPKAIFNSFIPFVSALLVGVVTYICKLIFKFNSFILYSATFILTVITAFFSYSIFFGVKVDFNLLNLIYAIQIGIICCFVCWILNIIVTKKSKKTL